VHRNNLQGLDVVVHSVCSDVTGVGLR
jgi:hypothetical protein